MPLVVVVAGRGIIGMRPPAVAGAPRRGAMNEIRESAISRVKRGEGVTAVVL